jgi:ACT domain-containing protein
MRGIAFDLQNRVGTLFFLLDAIVGGAVSILCIASSRRKTVELTLHTLSFISQQFGKDTTSGLRKCENLTTILINLKKALKNDKNCN